MLRVGLCCNFQTLCRTLATQTSDANRAYDYGKYRKTEQVGVLDLKVSIIRIMCLLLLC